MDVQTVEERLAALEQQIDSFAAEHSDFRSEFRSVQVSRRGAEGGRGETGSVGPAGAQGAPGDINETIKAAAAVMQAEFGTALAALSQVVVQELKHSGVIDENGNAVLIPGPKGDSITGSRGEKGDSITGAPGRNGADGVDGKTPDISEVVSVAKSEVNQFVEAKLSEFQNGLRNLILQILQERNVLDAQLNAVPGPAGPDGKPGNPGTPGEGVTQSDIAHMGAKFRNQWKNDIQAELRVHFAESHKD